MSVQYRSMLYLRSGQTSRTPTLEQSTIVLSYTRVVDGKDTALASTTASSAAQRGSQSAGLRPKEGAILDIEGLVCIPCNVVIPEARSRGSLNGAGLEGAVSKSRKQEFRILPSQH